MWIIRVLQGKTEKLNIQLYIRILLLEFLIVYRLQLRKHDLVFE